MGFVYRLPFVLIITALNSHLHHEQRPAIGCEQGTYEETLQGAPDKGPCTPWSLNRLFHTIQCKFVDLSGFVPNSFLFASSDFPLFVHYKPSQISRK